MNGGGVKYDHAIVSPVGKTGASPSIDLKVGDFMPVKLMGANGLIGIRAGQTVGHYIKLISLSSDATQFKLYDTSLARAIAKCGTPCAGLPAGGAGEDRLEKYIADNLLPWAAADFAPVEAGVVDEDTYVEQGRDLERVYSLAVINFILGHLQPDTDLAMVGYPFTDEVSHQFMALVTTTDADGDPNPCFDVTPKFDDVQCTGRGTAAPNRDPRGLHPQRLRGCRREARDRPRPDGRQPDDVRGLRPRLRAAVVRSQRKQGAEQRDGRRGVAARRRRERLQLQRDRPACHHTAHAGHGGEHRPHEGVLGRWHDPDLHQPRPPQELGEPHVPDVRGSADRSHEPPSRT